MKLRSHVADVVGSSNRGLTSMTDWLCLSVVGRYARIDHVLRLTISSVQWLEGPILLVSRSVGRLIILTTGCKRSVMTVTQICRRHWTVCYFTADSPASSPSVSPSDWLRRAAVTNMERFDDTRSCRWQSTRRDDSWMWLCWLFSCQSDSVCHSSPPSDCFIRRDATHAVGCSAVRIDYFCSRLIVDYFSFKTRTTFQRCTWQINKCLSMGWSCYDLLQSDVRYRPL